MILTYNWLKELVDFDFSPEELSHRLTMAGLEVDAMDKIGEGLDSVVVARLAAVEPHPNADRLTLCRVDTGAEEVRVVCGASNHRTGDLVALAQVGTVLPGNFKIKKSKIRGEASMGMLCSEKELGLAEEAEGIMILPPDLTPGQPVFEALGLKDVRYELGLTPNRPDCLSAVGVAREVAAMTGRSLKLPRVSVEEEGEAVDNLTSVTVEAPEHCPRYAARLIRGVTIGPSPSWLVRRLEAVGMRSINNVVDVTNFVLMELGHPLHAFDFNRLAGRRIEVRKARKGESFTTLDDQEHQLSEEDLTICDAEKAVALAGIMGGQNSEVQDDTTDILLESAYFDPLTIRRTSKRLGIHTESSHRFERGADVNMVPLALDRATALIRETAGGAVARDAIDAYEKPLKARKLTLTARRTNDILGLKLEVPELCRLLRSIELEAEEAGDRQDGAVYVTIPTFRPDLEREIDLVEEIARLNGYDRIPTTMPSGRIVCHRPPAHRARANRVRDIMAAGGFSEVVNYSFISPSVWDDLRLPEGDPRREGVRIRNPLTEEQSIMRTSLVPSVLETAVRNLSYRCRDLSLFEMRPVFRPRVGEDLPEEALRLTGLRCGRRDPEGWCQSQENVDFFDLKGTLEELFDRLAVDGLRWEPDAAEPFLHPGKSCAIRCGDKRLGCFGELHPKVQEGYDIEQPLYLFDLDLEAVFAAAGEFRGFQELSRYPDVIRDSAFLLDEEVAAQQVFEILEQARSPIVENLVLFDLYRGAGIPEGKKSLAVRARYRSAEKTLTEEEISAAHEKLVKAMKKSLAAELR